ncbi:MAG: Cd(II)/Pb(II)-responsive transcriptional regulator [Sulfuritalea sp.]|nr:Cd(II)/Pb(II)-responsive transcriptional regulator [Sulfuritalea sp.]
MKIGEIAQAAACPVETIRYYEREGLLPPTVRSSGNYRIYSAIHFERLNFIRRCRSLDMSLGEIRSLFQLRDSETPDCRAIDDLVNTHLLHVENRMRELRALKKQLRELLDACASPGQMAACGVLKGLSTGTAKPGSKLSHLPGTHR